MSEDCHVSGHVGSLEHSCEVCEGTAPAPCVHLGVKGMAGVLCTGEKAEQVSPDFRFVTCRKCREIAEETAKVVLKGTVLQVAEDEFVTNIKALENMEAGEVTYFKALPTCEELARAHRCLATIACTACDFKTDVFRNDVFTEAGHKACVELAQECLKELDEVPPAAV